MSTAIEFDHVGKQYRLGLVSTKTLSHDLDRWWKTAVLKKEDPYLKIGETNDRTTVGSSEYVWALRDIDFKVEQGDVVGIIGKNGAGKSTLLKLLSKVTGPTVGEIRARGRIGSLLEVGTGFHPEMTGRENIFMNGAIMGMTKAEVARKLDEIIDFSGCERYIDTPVKRYSSGMTVRLGFAVAAHLEPEILVVDEVLAVGDAEFQKKAIGKMQDVSRGEGRTVLFVSHNMASVRALCNHGVLLDNGRVAYMGPVNDVITHYISSNQSNLVDYVSITDAFRRPGPLRELEYVDIRMLNNVREMSSEEPMEFEMTIQRNNSRISQCQVGVIVKDEMDNMVGGLYSDPVTLPKDGNQFRLSLVLPNHNLARGKYSLNFNLSQFDFKAIIRDYDVVYGVLRFEVTHRDSAHQQPFVIWPFSGKCAFQGSKLSVQSVNSNVGL